jgi:O-methyltransferase
MSASSNSARSLFFRLLERCLTRDLFPDASWHFTLTEVYPFDRESRQNGRDWPTEAETMVGLKRLQNLEWCVSRVIEDRVPGDLVETGVWRGGCAILMRAVLAAYGETDRLVWLADSFEGLPAADPATYPRDAGDTHADLKPYLGVGIEIVQQNFRNYELLDSQVRFLKGWFRHTLPTALIDKIAVLRLDGDMYESTYVALHALYPKLASGGFVIIDDYGALSSCRAAVQDYRIKHGITEPPIEIDWTGVYWRKT